MMLNASVYGQAMTATRAAIRIAEPEAASVLSYRSATRCCSTRRARATSISMRVGGVGRCAQEESATLRDEDGLCAIADIEGLEHGTDVCLYRALRDIECARNLLVREPAPEHADDFELPERQSGGLRGERRARLCRDEHLAREHLLNCGDHLVGRERVRNETGCARRDGACSDSIPFIARDHDAGCRREARADQLQRMESVVALQVDVEQHEADVAIALHGLQRLRNGRNAQDARLERALFEH